MHRYRRHRQVTPEMPFLPFKSPCIQETFMNTLPAQLLLILCLFINVTAEAIDFSEEEKAYIASNPSVTVAMMPDFTPFAYYIENTPVGFEHDLLEIIAEKTGLYFEKSFSNWTTNYNAFKNKQADVITSISYKKFREPFTLFTSAYYEIPVMIFVRDDFGEYSGIDSLKNKRVGVLKDVFYVAELEAMNTMDLVYYDNYEALTEDLVFGKVDALLQNLTNINYLIKKNAYTNIKLASELSLKNTKKEDLRFGVRIDKPLLSSIMQKGLDSITKKEKEALVNKWIGSIKEYAGGHIELTHNEIAYLDQNVIKYCVNPSGLPFEGLNEKGEHVGMSADYYNLFEKMLSAKFELVKTNNWSESVSYIKQEKCDMLALGMETRDRREYLNFTSHYLEVPLVVATRVDVPFINNILDLEGEKIGIIRGDAFVDILRLKYPSLILVEVDDIKQGLDGVKNEELFAYIDTLASIGYEFQSEYFGELKIAGKIDEDLKLSMAVVKKDTVLLDILQKTVNNLSNETHREILTKWVPVKYENGTDYTLIWKVLIAALLLVALAFYLNIMVVKIRAKAKDDFLAVMSHELRTPMNAIAGLSALLKLSPLDSTQKDYVEKLESSSGYMMQLVNNVLDFAKVKNDSFELEQQAFRLDIALRSVISILEQKAEDKGLELNLLGEDLLTEAIIGDRGHLSQVLINLINNAIKYTEDGEVSLEVKQLPAPTDTSVRLSFSVLDSGIGIAAEDIKNLFDPYQRVVNAGSTTSEGVGLGLAISKSLVELMGGRLELESELGQGSRFYFDLVFDIAEDQLVSQEITVEDLGSFALPAGIQILLVDDASLNRYVGGEMIKNMGGNVSLASSGEGAIAQLQHKNFDVILMDIGLPGKDGFEVSQWIRRHSLNTSVPIIALTAHDLTQIKQKCQEAGMNGFLSKPFEYQDLYRAIDGMLNGEHLRNK